MSALLAGSFSQGQVMPMKLLLHSPLGLLLAEYDDEQLHALRFWRTGAHPPSGTRDRPAREDRLGRRLVEQLTEYFAGERRLFDLPLRPAPTPFQARVREGLLAIPYGGSCSYGELAAAIGHPGAARAVGQANARNPIPIIVPCHRVLASGGRMGGYLGEWGGGEGVGRMMLCSSSF